MNPNNLRLGAAPAQEAEVAPQVAVPEDGIAADLADLRREFVNRIRWCAHVDRERTNTVNGDLPVVVDRGVAAAIRRVANAAVADMLYVPADLNEKMPSWYHLLQQGARLLGMQLIHADNARCGDVQHADVWSEEPDVRDAYLAGIAGRADLVQSLSLIETLVDSIGVIPDFADSLGTGRKRALAFISSIMLTCHYEQKCDLAGKITSRYWRFVAPSQQEMAHEVAKVLNNMEASLLFVKAIDIMYRRFFRTSWRLWDTVDDNAILQLCEDMAQIRRKTLAGTYLEYLRKDKKTLPRRPVQAGAQRGRGNARGQQRGRERPEMREVEVLARPMIAKGPMTPREAGVIGRINACYSRFEEGFRDAEPFCRIQVEDLNREMEELVRSQYSATGAVSRLIAERRNTVRLDVLANRARAPPAGPQNRAVGERLPITPEEWAAAEQRLTQERGAAWEELFLETIRQQFALPNTFEGITRVGDNLFKEMVTKVEDLPPVMWPARRLERADERVRPVLGPNAQ